MFGEENSKTIIAYKVNSCTNHYTLHIRKKSWPVVLMQSKDQWFKQPHTTDLNTIIYSVCPYKEVSSHPKPLQCIKINLTLLKGFSAASRVSSLFCLCQQIQNAPLPSVNKVVFAFLTSRMHNNLVYYPNTITYVPRK